MCCETLNSFFKALFFLQSFENYAILIGAETKNKIKTMADSAINPNSAWQGYDRITPALLRTLKTNLPSFAPADIHTIETRATRPQCLERPGYLFCTLVAPAYNRATREIETRGLYAILTERQLITLLPQGPDERDLFDLTRLNAHTAPATQLAHIAERVCLVSQHAFNLLASDVEHLTVLTDQEMRLTVRRERALASRNASDLQGILDSLRQPIGRIADRAGAAVQTIVLAIDAVANRSRDLAALFGPVPFRQPTLRRIHTVPPHLQKTVRRYQTLGAIVVVLVLVATTFGFGSMTTPLLEHPLAFWLLGGTLVIAALGMLDYLRQRNVL